MNHEYHRTCLDCKAAFTTQYSPQSVCAPCSAAHVAKVLGRWPTFEGVFVPYKELNHE
jgi:hypothetical protein